MVAYRFGKDHTKSVKFLIDKNRPSSICSRLGSSAQHQPETQLLYHCVLVRPRFITFELYTHQAQIGLQIGLGLDSPCAICLQAFGNAAVYKRV